MRFSDDSAAFARNWKVIVAVDLAMGAAILVAGAVLALSTSGWGWALATVGVIYLFFGLGRVTKWRRLRRQAGL